MRETLEPFSFSGPALREARESAGLTREQFALNCGRTVQTVWAWESGKTAPGPSMQPLVAAVLAGARPVVAEIVRRTTRASGVPIVVEDSAAIAQVAEILGDAR
jgi:transcriptional regulator with XRE-family HTH domain